MPAHHGTQRHAGIGVHLNDVDADSVVFLRYCEHVPLTVDRTEAVLQSLGQCVAKLVRERRGRAIVLENVDRIAGTHQGVCPVQSLWHADRLHIDPQRRHAAVATTLAYRAPQIPRG